MKKRIYLILFMILSLSSTSFYSSNQIHAENSLEKINREIKELENKQKEISANTKKIENKINEIKTEQKDLKRDINLLDLQLNELANKINKKEEEIEETKGELEKLGNLLVEAEARVEKRDELLKTRVKAMYETGDVSYLEVLLDSSSIGDFLTRLDMVQKIVDSDTTILEENIKDKEAIAANKKEVEDLMAKLTDQYAALTDQQQEFEKKYNEKTVKVKSLMAREDEYLIELEKADNELKKLATDLSKKREAKKKLTYAGGKLLWPVPDSHKITDDFGPRIHPITKKKSNHSGVDIGGTPIGTDIVAAEDGVVILAAYYGAYGNTVMIDHGGGIVTMYGHIRNGGIKVKEGQEVKRGKKIAEVGSTGSSTGPHLHFSVIKDGEYIDPMKYLK